MAAASPPTAASQQAATMLCCNCGAAIAPNPSSMCAHCLSSKVDITEGISTQLTVHRCRGCERWLKPGWIDAELESAELMALCIKKVRGLQKVKLIDAQWIWTEPHSMRLKVKLTIQKEVIGHTILQQSFVAEFIVRNRQCEECAKQYTDGTWKSVVQVRQRVDHKRTFYYLEQLLLKHNAHSRALSIQSFRDGMDFYFTERNEAVRFVDFMQSVVPVRVKNTKKLISSDNHSNLFNYKFTHLMNIVPFCKDDVVVLPRQLARQLGDISPLVLVERVTSLVHLVDPLTCDRASFDITCFTKISDSDKAGGWSAAVFSSPRLIEYIILGVEAALPPQRAGAASQVFRSKTRLAAVEVARASDLGVNDIRFRTMTHLGHLLNAGDTVLGYDVASGTGNMEDDERERIEKRQALPDVVLVRKLYGAESKKRGWRLRKLQVDVVEEDAVARRDVHQTEQRDYETFMQQLEGDREMRKQVNLYRDERAAAGLAVDMDEQEAMAAPGDSDLGSGGLGGGAADDAAAAASGAAGPDDEEELRPEELLAGLTLDDDDAVPDEEDVRYLRGDHLKFEVPVCEPQTLPNRASSCNVSSFPLLAPCALYFLGYTQEEVTAAAAAASAAQTAAAAEFLKAPPQTGTNYNFL